MIVEFIEKDQIYQNETTNYWFTVNGERWAISDCNGELTLLDCDGCPCAHNYPEIFNLLADEYTNYISEF